MVLVMQVPLLAPIMMGMAARTVSTGMEKRTKTGLDLERNSLAGGPI